MAQDVIDQLRELCERLREQLMQQPEYRALMSLEKTIADLEACAGSLAGYASAAPVSTALDPDDIDAGISMRQGADHVAEALADALQRKPARPADHLPSHRVA